METLWQDLRQGARSFARGATRRVSLPPRSTRNSPWPMLLAMVGMRGKSGRPVWGEKNARRCRISKGSLVYLV